MSRAYPGTFGFQPAARGVGPSHYQPSYAGYGSPQGQIRYGQSYVPHARAQVPPRGSHVARPQAHGGHSQAASHSQSHAVLAPTSPKPLVRQADQRRAEPMPRPVSRAQPAAPRPSGGETAAAAVQQQVPQHGVSRQVSLPTKIAPGTAPAPEPRSEEPRRAVNAHASPLVPQAPMQHLQVQPQQPTAQYQDRYAAPLRAERESTSVPRQPEPVREQAGQVVRASRDTYAAACSDQRGEQGCGLDAPQARTSHAAPKRQDVRPAERLDRRPPTSTKVPPRQSAPPTRVPYQQQPQQPYKREERREERREEPRRAQYSYTPQGSQASRPGVQHQQRVTPRENLEKKLDPMEKIRWKDLALIEQLGSGEFGQVYRGHYRRQEVAIKQLYWDNSIQGETVTQDLEKEIESFRHLSHKRLVKFIGACLELPNLALVTEYMPGGSLHHLLHVRKVQLPLHHAVNMCQQLTDGVQYLHAQTPIVVHRDLKSLNVVLDMSLNVKICDFGLTESMERTHITKKNNGGSPRYMAPELFDDKSKLTEKIDIWAMGCIFVEIFGGPLPYEGCNSLVELTRAILVEKKTPVVPSHIHPLIQPLLRKCLGYYHEQRLSAKQVYQELKNLKRNLRLKNALAD